MVISSVTGLKTSYFKEKEKLQIAAFLISKLAGVTGIEPVNGEFRVHCLTAWLHPKGMIKTGQAGINGLQ